MVKKIKILFKGVVLSVKCDWYRGESARMDANTGSVDFGSGDEVEIIEITHKGTDIYELLENQMEDVRDELLHELNKV